MNHYPRHIGDFAAATQGLSLAERGAYTALLDQYYAHEKPLPKSKPECYRMAMAVTAQERKAVDYVLQRYFTEGDDGWRQKRCDQEIARFKEKSEKAAGSASVRWSRNGANAMRTHNETHANALRTDMRTQSDGNASHKPLAVINLGLSSGKGSAREEPDKPIGDKSPSESTPSRWWDTEAGIKAKGVEVGLGEGRPGESFRELKARIFDRIAEQQRRSA